MPSCVMRYCHNHAKKINKSQGVTYHRFPCDEVARQDWIAVVRAQRCERDWLPTRSSIICSNHFESEHKYTSDKGRIRLKKTAVPFFKKNENPPQAPPRSDSPNSLEDVDISDVTPYFDSPKEFALKQRVSQLMAEKEIIQKQNRAIKQQNNRLKKKLTSLRASQKILKRKLLNRATVDGTEPEMNKSDSDGSEEAATIGVEPTVIKTEVATIEGAEPVMVMIKSEPATVDAAEPTVIMIKSEPATVDAAEPTVIMIKSEPATADAAEPTVIMIKSEVATIDGAEPKVIKSEVVD